MSRKIALCMPIFNEADGIQSWLTELFEHRNISAFELILVNDCSTDLTLEVIKKFPFYQEITILNNPKNLGHGPSLVRAMNYVIEHQFEFILTADGDGQISAQDLLHFFSVAVDNNFTYAEAIRKFRNEPWYRKFVTLVTRLLVLVYSGNMPRDANTPIRFYSFDSAVKFWSRIPEMNLVPNLLVSIASRKDLKNVPSIEVATRVRRGNIQLGSTWKSKGKGWRLVPPRKFLQFCYHAFKDLTRAR